MVSQQYRELIFLFSDPQIFLNLLENLPFLFSQNYNTIIFYYIILFIKYNFIITESITPSKLFFKVLSKLFLNKSQTWDNKVLDNVLINSHWIRGQEELH